MVFNVTAGRNPDLGTALGTFEALEEPQVLTIPLALQPLMIVLKTSCGAVGEMAVYYRARPGEEFAEKTAGSCPVITRLHSAGDTAALAIITGASAANSARVEYYILGVNRE